MDFTRSVESEFPGDNSVLLHPETRRQSGERRGRHYGVSIYHPDRIGSRREEEGDDVTSDCRGTRLTNDNRERVIDSQEVPYPTRDRKKDNVRIIILIMIHELNK